MTTARNLWAQTCWIALLVSAGCGSPPKARPPAPAHVAAPQPVEPEEIEIPRAREGTIARARLHQTLDQGVGRFLSGLEVKALRRQGAFVGWTIVHFDNPWVDLVPGDLVMSVNGHKIETPAQVQSLWMKLRGADEIAVSAIRRGEPFELRFAVDGEVEIKSP